MPIDYLDAPLRITWDLHGEGPPLPAGQLLAVVDRLVEAGVFFVTLQEQPLVHPQIHEFLHRLAEGGCQTMVVCSGTPEEIRALAPSLPIRTVFLDAGSFARTAEAGLDGLHGAVEAIRGQGFEPQLLMVPGKDNVAMLLQLLDFCRSAGIGKFKLPNVKIVGSLARSAAENLLDADDVDRLRADLAAYDGDPASGVALEVHDLFLWELLCPDSQEGRSEYGGCQAGNSLGHIDSAGNLYPCSSWPEILGSLLDHPLETLWAGKKRGQVRAEVAGTPSDCAGCADFGICFGGCRGLSRTLFPGGEARDPLCRGRR